MALPFFRRAKKDPDVDSEEFNLDETYSIPLLLINVYILLNLPRDEMNHQ